MGTTDVLRSSIRHTHEGLAARLDTARVMESPAADPRLEYQRIDTFLAGTSKHLHAVDAVLLSPTRRRVSGGADLVHGYVHSVKDLEVELAHVKAHEYGSVYESSFAWSDVWADVATAMAAQRAQEEELGERLTERLDDAELDRLTERLHSAELRAPSRPHPYTPHTGLRGLVSRRVMHAVDRFWDHVEGRMIPEPERAPRKRPGLLAQYVLGDPRFDEKKPRPRA